MDPFSTNDLLKLDVNNIHPEDSWHGFKLDIDLQSDSLRLAEVEDVKIPNLRSDVLKLSLDDVSLDILDASETISSTSEAGIDATDNERSDDFDDAIWDPAFLSDKQPKRGLLSWDRFQGLSEQAAGPRYLSETGSSVFDAITSQLWYAKHRNHLKFVRLDRFRQAVLNVLVGRSSLIFEWTDAISSFETQLGDFALPGLSPAITAALCKTFCSCGTSYRSVQAFCKSSAGTTATTWAIQSCLLQILHGIEVGVQREGMASLTLMGLWSIGRKHTEVYEIMNALVAMTRTSKSETHVVEAVIKHIDEIWSSSPPLRAMLTNLAERILQPAIRDTCQRIELITGASNDAADADWILGGLLPGYLSMFQETVNCLHVAKISNTQITSPRPDTTDVKLVFRWTDLAAVQQQAGILELEIRKALGKPMTGTKSTPGLLNLPELSREDVGNPFAVNFDLAPSAASTFHQHTASDARLTNLVIAAFQEDTDDAGPELELSPVQMLDMCLTPFLKVKHRACSYQLLRSQFLQYDLVAHLDLLYSFQLMGDGLFTSRLSRALFDEDQYSAEGRRKTGLTAGLRLEDREAWPPASSELRLVLMGLLSDSSHIHHSAELLECISFAIRDLPEEDLERCRDVQSIHALDFLRLVYAPPNPILELVFTTSVLDKYDRIFQFLLVLLRMHAFTQSMMATIISRKSTIYLDKSYHRFYLDLHHFVTTFLDYALNVAIGVPFKTLFRYFGDIRDALLVDDYERCISLAESTSKLRKAQEDTLDQVLTALLLQRDQANILAATCKIFSMGLKSSADQVNELEPKTLTRYRNFGLALNDWYYQAHQLARTSGDANTRVLDDLLTKMDYSGYHEQSMKRSRTLV